MRYLFRIKTRCKLAKNRFTLRHEFSITKTSVYKVKFKRKGHFRAYKKEMTKNVLVLIISFVIITIYQNNYLTWYGSGPERISGLGYQVEVHKVTTADGYILELHRIPYPPRSEDRKIQRPVVLFVHGGYSSSDCFLVTGVENSLGFQAANEGYDVWLINLRGNHYSMNHLNLSTFSMRFWEHSYHEMAIFDIPASIDYIAEKTGQQKFHYVGHSMGSVIYLVLLSEKPEYNNRLKTGHLLSAGVNPEDTVIRRVLLGDVGVWLANLFNHGSFGIHFHLNLVKYFLWLMCQMPVLKFWCLEVVSFVGGHSTTCNMVIIVFAL